MLVSIHVVARLLRLPVLRIDGDVLLLDDDRLGTAASRLDGHRPRDRRELTAGRLLALAEAEMATVEEQHRRRRRVVSGSNGSRPAGEAREEPRG